MKLRDHPLMSHRGVRTWPPTWIQRNPPNKLKARLRGEIGILKRVLCHRDMHNECFLIIEHGGDAWIGALMIDNWAFCAQIGDVLQSHIGHSIKEIGDIDLSFTL